MTRNRTYTPLLLSVLALQLGACATWQPAPVGPRELIEAERPASVRVLRLDGTTTVVRDPRIENDSIVTVTGECRRLQNSPGYVCPTTAVVALTDVLRLDTRRISATTGWSTVAGVGIVFALVVLAAGFEAGF